MLKVNVKAFIFFVLKQLLTKFREKSFYKGRLFVYSSIYLGHHAHTKRLYFWIQMFLRSIPGIFYDQGDQLVIPYFENDLILNNLY